MKPRIFCLLLCQLVLCWTRAAVAHEFRPATLMLQEIDHGRFRVEWETPTLPYDLGSRDQPEFPPHCRYHERLLECGEAGLVGDVRFPMLEGTTQRVFFRVRWLGGTEQTLVLSGGESAHLDGGRGVDSALRVARQYVSLGAQHIWLGIDHLLFVLGLMVLVRRRRRLVLTITAFTLAHSVTLALATLGFVSVPQAPVEAAIALSILLLAAECAELRPSLTRRYPWLVAFGFGLLHGFGFAGALSQAGLPPRQVPAVLFFFNVGVELGQVAVVMAAWGLASVVVRAHRGVERLNRPLVYVMGTAAAYWTIERVALAVGLA